MRGSRAGRYLPQPVRQDDVGERAVPRVAPAGRPRDDSDSVTSHHRWSLKCLWESPRALLFSALQKIHHQDTKNTKTRYAETALRLVLIRVGMRLSANSLQRGPSS